MATFSAIIESLRRANSSRFEARAIPANLGAMLACGRSRMIAYQVKATALQQLDSMLADAVVLGMPLNLELPWPALAGQIHHPLPALVMEARALRRLEYTRSVAGRCRTAPAGHASDLRRRSIRKNRTQGGRSFWNRAIPST